MSDEPNKPKGEPEVDRAQEAAAEGQEPAAAEPEPEPAAAEPAAAEPEPEPANEEPKAAKAEPEAARPEPAEPSAADEPYAAPAAVHDSPSPATRPELIVGAAFVGGLVLAWLLKRRVG